MDSIIVLYLYTCNDQRHLKLLVYLFTLFLDVQLLKVVFDRWCTSVWAQSLVLQTTLKDLNYVIAYKKREEALHLHEIFNTAYHFLASVYFEILYILYVLRYYFLYLWLLCMTTGLFREYYLPICWAMINDHYVHELKSDAFWEKLVVDFMNSTMAIFIK